jgi:putative endonuclease
MSFARKKLGASGEDAALEFLLKKHFILVARNVRLSCGEIDLLMQDGQTLVIVEVKTKSNKDFGLAEEEVDWHKQKKLLSLARVLSFKYPDQSVRIDVVAINGNDINHIVNAVEG